MGGGGAVRAAAKVAGIAVGNAGIRRGAVQSSPAEQCMKNVSRPVSPIVASANSGDMAATVQRPAWELDDWELAGGVEEESEMPLNGNEPLPRVVFGGRGGAPSLQEAKAATAELKDAINKVYLSSPSYTGSVSSFGGAQLSGHPSVTKSDNFESKSCITCNPKADVPKHAMMAFALLNESAAAQSVVASIARDPNVWDAVLKNESLQEFLQSQASDVEAEDMASMRKSTELSNNESQGENFGTETASIESSDDANQDGIFKTAHMDLLNNIKLTVTEMVSSVSAYLQSIFGFSSVGKTAVADEISGPTFTEKTLGASFIGLAMMVIMVVILKRG